MAGKALRATLTGDEVDAVITRARGLGLHGWARIAEDDAGTTAVHAEGADAAVDALEAWLGEHGGSVVRAKVEGHEQFAIRGVTAGAFRVVEADGSFWLTLEVDGSSRVWVLRKAPSMDPADKRGARAVDLAPAADAGAVWDEGTYEQGGRVTWPEAIDRGHAVFVLHGTKLQGGFALQRTRPLQWLLIKRRDAHAIRAS